MFDSADSTRTKRTETLTPGDVIDLLNQHGDRVTIKGVNKGDRALATALGLVVAFLGGALVALGLSLILRALP